MRFQRRPTRISFPAMSLLGVVAAVTTACGGPTSVSKEPPKLLSVTVTGVTHTSATLGWTTDQPTSARVELSTEQGATGPTRVVTASGLQVSHTLSLTDLLPGIGYDIRVLATNASGQTATSQVQSFGTPAYAEGPVAATLVVVEFSVVEFQYPSAPGHWYYAPVVDVRETSGVSNAVVTKIAGSIPGIGNPPPMTTSKCVGAGQRMSLLPELYGDYPLTFDNSNLRATADTATLAITYEDNANHVATITASGPIVPGGLPTTYTGGSPTWACAGVP